MEASAGRSRYAQDPCHINTKDNTSKKITGSPEEGLIIAGSHKLRPFHVRVCTSDVCTNSVICESSMRKKVTVRGSTAGSQGRTGDVSANPNPTATFQQTGAYVLVEVFDVVHEEAINALVTLRHAHAGGRGVVRVARQLRVAFKATVVLEDAVQTIRIVGRAVKSRFNTWGSITSVGGRSFKQ